MKRQDRIGRTDRDEGTRRPGSSSSLWRILAQVQRFTTQSAANLAKARQCRERLSIFDGHALQMHATCVLVCKNGFVYSTKNGEASTSSLSMRLPVLRTLTRVRRKFARE